MLSQTTPRGLASTAQLLQPEAFSALRAAHVAVIGLGGVGSWAAEALGRSGVGRLTLVDFDHVAESNLNRQVQATTRNLGQAKTEALRDRLAIVAPHTEVQGFDAFLTPENAAEIRSCGAHFFIDACDDVAAKTALVLQFSSKQRPRELVVCGAAGGKRNPTRVAYGDLAETSHDPLLAKLRYGLRRGYGFPREGRLLVSVVYSAESVQRPIGGAAAGRPGSALACAGYGSIVTVTAAMGMAAAARALHWITRSS
jgi:tRNA A37 threonylcarbamoyladenosine dehydratase